MANSDSEIAQLTGALRVDRAVFRGLYDAAVRTKPGALPFIALAAMRDRSMPGLTGADKDKADFIEGLRQL